MAEQYTDVDVNRIAERTCLPEGIVRDVLAELPVGDPEPQGSAPILDWLAAAGRLVPAEARQTIEYAHQCDREDGSKWTSDLVYQAGPEYRRMAARMGHVVVQRLVITGPWVAVPLDEPEGQQIDETDMTEAEFDAALASGEPVPVVGPKEETRG